MNLPVSLLLSTALLAPATARAGQTCQGEPLSAHATQRALELAVKTQLRLEQLAQAQDTQVVLLARQGRNLDEWGLRWSHLGYAYREVGPDGNAAWRVVHKLNACGTAQGQLHRQGLAPFFLDDLHRYQAGILPLSPATQQALLPMLRDDRQAAALQHTPYNMVAYPFAWRYQQSNQWALETLAAAVEPSVLRAGSLSSTPARVRVQSWLRFKGYAPGVLHVSALQRLGARMGTAHIAFDDHPDAARYAGRIATVTVESVLDFVEQQQLGGPLLKVD